MTTEGDQTSVPEPAEDPNLGDSSAETQKPDPQPQEHMIPKTRFDEVNARLRKLEREQAAAAKAEETARQQALEEQGQAAAVNEELRAKIAALESEKVQAQLALLKIKVGARLKLPSPLIDRLQGETEEELEADGKVLLAALPNPQVGGTDPANGTSTKPPPTAEPTDQELKERAARLGVSVDHLKQHLESIRS